ncbi:MAG: hypothetical protein RDV48_27170 [Candidatus Eremiobacteraeota bacterium]|nr:hypothetical protein [Candidatus Eremiobacteraeota bacterium]
MPERAQVIDDKKFMWDGRTYETEQDAHSQRDTYEKDSFETRVLPDGGGKFLIYTRKVVTEVKTE